MRIDEKDLFNDIEDKNLRNRNRAVFMSNVAEQYTKKDKITPKGANLIFSYFQSIPVEDQKDVEQRFSEEMKLRGYSVS